ncbi:GNAT family N-acetyltransferase [Devosia ginsengisoli]|uniref:GNAT family N-acetyltransferase n=1 Tax=Devosia ginsengisoli TaxID=400770 RepID=A0A5B8LTW1_9HYPH|nr:GNAT family N-acetyltransferase [Devosia ginsengisoli]QDZ11727.1 GNAT family N-acetyltransferase [Devosia ginsengisoli]
MTDLPTPERMERAGLEAWPGIEVEWDGNWVRRAAGGYTKRANSLQCFDPADSSDAEKRLAAGVDWFKARGIAPVVRTTPLASSSLNAALDAQGWAEIDRSHLYAMELRPQEPDAEGRTTDLLDPGFLAAQQSLQGHDDALMARMRALLAVMAVPAVGIVVERDGVAVASGLMAIADGIVITGNVITDRARRRQGLGMAMMRTGLAWAKAQGATVAALNVQADNAAGMALYASLGYRHQYDYTYRIPRQA